MGCGCGSNSKATTRPQSTLSSSGNFTQQSIGAEVPAGDGQAMTVIQYVGPIAETFSIRSRVMPSVVYRFGNNQYHKVKSVFMQDAEYLMGMRDGNDNPLYTTLGSGAAMETRDPAAFLGTSVGV